MKKLTSLIPVLFLLSLNAFSQNLILNPGFEFCTDPNNCIPSDRGQITRAANWYTYNNSNYSLNGSNSWYSPDLFDKRADTNNCNVISSKNANGKPYKYPIVGIPHNFFTLGNDMNSYQQLDSINTDSINHINNRFAALEANDPTFINGSITPTHNRALMGTLAVTLNNNYKNKGYIISFWAAAASFWNGTESSVGQSAWNNDIIDVSLLDYSNGHEKLISVSNYTGTSDSSVFQYPIVEHGFCISYPPCEPPYQTPYGKWNHYQAKFCMSYTDYPDNYNYIVFKLNRIKDEYPDVPDVFIDDVALYALDSPNDSNRIAIQPDTLRFCSVNDDYSNNPSEHIPWFSVPATSSEPNTYTWQYENNHTGNWINIC